MDWLRRRFEVARKIADRRWVKITLAIYAGIAFYDLFVSQFVPESWAKRFPKMHELIASTSGWLPLWGWLLILAGIVAVACFEYAVRRSSPKRTAVVSIVESGPKINLSAAPVQIAQEGLFPAKYIQIAVHAVGSLPGCQVTLNEVAKVDGGSTTVVYDQPLNARWSGTPALAIDINDGQETRANLFSISHIAQFQRYFIIPRTVHEDEALRRAVTEPALYRLTVLASSKTTAPVKKSFMLRWSGSFEDVKFWEGNAWTERDQLFPASQHGDKVPLFEAATQAVEQTSESDISVLAFGLSDSPDDILIWYCNYMTRNKQLLTLYGNKPPSRKEEEIYLAPLGRYDFVVGSNSIVLQEHYGKMRYENLMVKTDQLNAAIQELLKVKA